MIPQSTVPPSMTVREVADTLRVSRRTVHRYVDLGEFPNVWRTLGGLRIPVADVDAFRDRMRRS